MVFYELQKKFYYFFAKKHNVGAFPGAPESLVRIFYEILYSGILLIAIFYFLNKKGWLSLFYLGILFTLFLSVMSFLMFLLHTKSHSFIAGGMGLPASGSVMYKKKENKWTYYLVQFVELLTSIFFLALTLYFIYLRLKT